MKTKSMQWMPTLLLISTVQPLMAQEKTPPNVIYILADDLGYGDIGCNGQKKIKTPNLDLMAQKGMKFTQHYAGCTVSAPSRCSLVTGKHTGHSAIRGNIGEDALDGRTYDTSLPKEEFTLGELFKSMNYSTACIGKWGMGGPGTEGHPNRQGFDYFYGYLGQGHAHWYFPKFLHENEQEIKLPKGSYSHDLIENKALEYIRSKAKSNFFLYLTFTLPHAELQIPLEYQKNYRDAFMPEQPFPKGKGYSPQERPHAVFASMVERLDTSVGRVIALLKELGIDDNTLVIFTSDNGPHKEGGADPEFFNSNSVYKGTKRDLYEGGIRMPMIAQWPGKIKEGSVNSKPSAFWDIMPTMAEIIGAETPKGIDGISILPTLLGQQQIKHHDHFYWEFHEQGGKQAVLQGKWKLIKFQVKNTQKSYYELYNIESDPGETKNVYSKNSSIAKKLIAIMNSEHTMNPLFKLYEN